MTRCVSLLRCPMVPQRMTSGPKRAPYTCGPFDDSTDSRSWLFSDLHSYETGSCACAMIYPYILIISKNISARQKPRAIASGPFHRNIRYKQEMGFGSNCQEKIFASNQNMQGARGAVPG